MLKISRKEGTSFQVGEATIHISEIQGKQVRIAIDAPKHIKIERDDMRKPKKNKNHPYLF